MALKIRKKANEPKKVPFTYLLLNIKIRSNKRSGEQAYKKIFENIYANTITEHVGRGKRAFIRTLFSEKEDGKEFYYGKITRFTDLENNSWVSVITREDITMNLENGLYPNKQETDYVFIPQAHRLAIKLSAEFTIKNAQDFFTKAIDKVVSSDEQYSVTIQQSEDVFEEIYRADKVENLHINVTYTNSDEIGDDAADWLDGQLKQSNIGEANLSFEAGKNETINLDTPLIRGGLNLAKENGEVEATVKEVSGRRRRIITKEHPEKNRGVATSEDNQKNVIFKQVMQRYRSSNE